MIIIIGLIAIAGIIVTIFSLVSPSQQTFKQKEELKEEKVKRILVGVYICECGPNIKEGIDLSDVISYVENLENVYFVKKVNLLCSEKGKETLLKDLQEKKPTHLVIAACSPKEHEETFRKLLKEAGFNPYLFQMVNIREHCVWLMPDKKQATQLSKVMIKAAIKRVINHEPLVSKEIETCPDVLVIGAGVAGISAALTLAQKNRKVFLLERLPYIGGKVVRYEDVFPHLECASCMLEPKIDEVLHHENIEVITLAEVEEILGFYGNFLVKIKRKPRYVNTKLCISCGACIEACPVEVKNEFLGGLTLRKAIYFPFPGALPPAPLIDSQNCLHLKGENCDACQKACAFGAINYQEKEVQQEIKVGAIVIATGFDLLDVKKIPQLGYGKIENVYTSLEFENILSSSGPYKGEIRLKDGRSPTSIVFIHCVGSRTPLYREYCSAICCSYLAKFTYLVKEKLPDASLIHLYRDFCFPIKEMQRFFEKKVKRLQNVEFIRIKDINEIKISQEGKKICILLSSDNKKIECDMVVLAPALEGSQNNEKIAKLLDISIDEAKFFIPLHSKLSPQQTTNEGIFICGGCRYPQDITTSVTEGKSAAGEILKRLIPGEKIELEPTISVVNKDVCSGCKTCIGVCPYKAISFDEEEKCAVISEVLCRGCGICSATCPAGAIEAKHFTQNQIKEEIEGLLENV